MKTNHLNFKIIVKWGLALMLSGIISGCSAPRLFQFQDTNFFVSSSGQAQLGNLGLMTADDGFGFQRVAFLSDCQNHSLPVSIDATIHGIVPLQNAFGPGTRAKQLSILLGVPKESLSESSVLLFAISPLDAQHSAKNWPEACKKMVGRDAQQTRLILSVAALIPHHLLSPHMASAQLTAQISPRGHITLTVHEKKKREISVSPQAIFAWRSGHFCWAPDPEIAPILRSDDPSFAPCPEGYGTVPPPGSPWASDQMAVESEAPPTEAEPMEETPPIEPKPEGASPPEGTTPSI